MSMENLIKPQRQTNWDWRAAGNFIGGGTGTGLLLWLALSGSQSVLLLLAALALIALGLFCVWLEIGRPLRALNVFLHAKTSWMTREALIAPPLFLCGALAAWSGSVLWLWCAALLAAAFLFCQARIIHAAKGIPAWRAQGTIPLFIATGLTEGAGLLAFAQTVHGMPHGGWLAPVLLLLLVLRALLWRAYRKELAEQNTPRATLAVLESIQTPFMMSGTVAAAAVLLAAMLLPTLNAPALVGAAGLLALLSGWLLKYTIIVRASFNQGYALPRLPVRGAGVSS